MPHQLAPLVEQIAAPIGRFGLVLDHMGKRRLANLIREIRAFRCPISQGETLHRHAIDLHAVEHHFKRDDGQGFAGARQVPRQSVRR
jgi:hypothetical protein